MAGRMMVAPMPAVPSDAGAAPLDAVPEQTFRSLLRTLGLLRRVMEPYFARHGVSGSQWAVLRTLMRAEDDGVRQLRLTDLGDRLLIRPPSVTGVVDRLQKMGLVARVASPTDQRVKNVSLTAAGRKLVRRVLQHHPEQVRSVLAGLSPPEQAELHRLLGRLGSHLEDLQDDTRSSAEAED
jgi:DNA-binding MarR family transcriptional regulator